MFPLICGIVVIFIPVCVIQLLPARRKQHRQIRFIRETLAGDGTFENRRVIASLSTLPGRINNLRPTIRSLLRQTRPPDEIIIAVPEFSIREKRHYVVPKYLSELPRVRIWHCDRDWGPATKYIDTVREELAAGRGDTLIMVVDDDRVYPRDILATYLHYHTQMPDAALCIRGAAMPRTFDWRDATMIYGSEIREPQNVAVITGCGSYLIQPRFFDESLWDYSQAPTGAFYMDDIWISGYLSRRNIARFVVPASGKMRGVRRQRRTLSLHDVPNGRQHHNNETIAFFRDAWDVFASPKDVCLSDECDDATIGHRK
jgi:cellulose synthase/poly-beta-1,6-N-acetylglucosamine synthase-like glycosyltransferase